MASRFNDRSGNAEDPYAAAAKVQRGVDNDVRRTLREHWDIPVRSAQPLLGGEASSVWKIETDDEPVVVRLAPQHIATAHLEQVLRIQASVSVRIPVVPVPTPSRSNPYVHLSRANPISVQSFRPGQIRDDLTPEDQIVVARTLADIHLGLDLCSPPAPPLPTYLSVDWDQPVPDELKDDELDNWLGSLPTSSWHRGLIHGDYYVRNILWKGDCVSGVIDWDELTLDWREQELAWSIWEFCHSADGTRLNVQVARDFMNAYLSRNPNIGPAFPNYAYRFIQRRLRAECISALRNREAGRPFDVEYFESELAAFRNVRGATLGATLGTRETPCR